MPDSDMDMKLNELWTDSHRTVKRVSEMEQNFARLEANVEAIANSVQSIGESIGAVVDRQNTSGRTNWGVLISAAALTVVVVTGMLGFMQFTRTQDMDKIEMQLIYQDKESQMRHDYQSDVLDQHQEWLERQADRVRAINGVAQ